MTEGEGALCSPEVLGTHEIEPSLSLLQRSCYPEIRLLIKEQSGCNSTCIARNMYTETITYTAMSKHTTTVIKLRVSTDRNSGTIATDRWHAH